MFENQPKGLYALALANTGERFGYYTMLAVFVLFLQANFGWGSGTAGSIYATFLGLVYFLPLFGGMLADRLGYGKMVTAGISIMFLGYVLLAIPLGSNWVAVAAMGSALLLISFGTGLFKGNLQVMVGNLYDDPRYSNRREAGFSLFYMAINIGAMFAPTAAIAVKNWAMNSLGYEEGAAYHFAFGVACVSLIVSMAIYYGLRSWFAGADTLAKKKDKADDATAEAAELTPAENKERIVALCLVFAVVIFFWMAFHQNGSTLTLFAKSYTQTSSSGLQSMLFDVTNLVACIFIVYALFALFQSKTAKGKGIAGIVILAALAFLGWKYTALPASTDVDAPIFQQFNPCFVVALTPVSVALFSWLGKKGKEPSSPRKIGLGMLVAAMGFGVMIASSVSLPRPAVADNIRDAKALVKQHELLVSNPAAADSILNKIKGEDAKADKDGFEAAFDLQTANASDVTKHLTFITPEERIACVKSLPETKVAEFKAYLADEERVSANWLILTYLILTFAELLLSPIGISFVSKVAPPKLKGMMMGGWFVATALGNFLVAIPALLWSANVSLPVIWGSLACICLLSALFIFSILKRLEKVS
ncbi:MAG: peptide MFS transporter [Bacteroidaceae bacterium]|nr:peptide MFS transporter [Bacteroidaceae bacterium]MBR1593922.1 peptide MFS transporter [Alloprevotella sp.]